MARRPERERHFFLDGGGGRLHCVEHLPPPDLSNGKAVVLCRPIWGERIRTHRVFASLGRHLSGKGFSVVACDYHGDGNSGGATLDLSFTGMVADVKRLHAYLLETHKPRGFAVVGLRAGANCALAAAREKAYRNDDAALVGKLALAALMPGLLGRVPASDVAAEVSRALAEVRP